MLELNFKKKYKKTRAMIIIYCYDNTRDRLVLYEKAQKELGRIIADMMLDEGWRKDPPLPSDIQDKYDDWRND